MTTCSHDVHRVQLQDAASQIVQRARQWLSPLQHFLSVDTNTKIAARYGRWRRNVQHTRLKLLEGTAGVQDRASSRLGGGEGDDVIVVTVCQWSR
jgi:hypothetical protein